MRAAVATGTGSIEHRELTDPEARPGEVVIAVQGAGVGFVDVMAVRGQYPYFPGPGSSPGLEAVGDVVAVGTGVASSWIGQKVLALPAFGGFAELVAVPATRAFPVSESMPVRELLGLGLNAIVALAATQKANIRVGEQVLVRGAGGGIGMHLVQLARARGAEVTAVTSSAERARSLTSLGATRTIGRGDAATEEGSLDVVLDTAAGDQVALFLRRLAVDGRYILCGGAAGAPGLDIVDAFMDTFHHSPTLTAVSLNSASDGELRGYWDEVIVAFNAGALQPVFADSFPLERAADALDVVAERPPFGKVVLDVS